ncbi:hypothetical protein MTO96_003779 [Rhipicephalus appendiculatus]
MAFVFKVIVVYVVAYYGTFVPAWALRTAGFGHTGVRPKTLASRIQAKYNGVVPKDGIFAALQKWGMTGVPIAVPCASSFLAAGIAARCFRLLDVLLKR